MTDWVTAILASGLTASTVGQIMNAGRTGRRERRKERRDQEMRALHSTLDATYNVLAIFNYQRLGTHEVQGTPELDEALRELRKAAAFISDSNLRERLTFNLRALGYTSGIAGFSKYSQISTGHALCQYSADLLLARIRQERLPPEPSQINDFRSAIAEADAAESEYYSSSIDPKPER